MSDERQREQDEQPVSMDDLMEDARERTREQRRIRSELGMQQDVPPTIRTVRAMRNRRRVIE